MNAPNTIIFPLTQTEARALVKEIRANAAALGEKLLELYERQGWRALGYSNWRACVIAEFDFQQSQAYRLLDFARVERNLSPIGEIYPLPTNEAQARPLSVLEPEQQREAWQTAVESAHDGKPTAAHVQRVVDDMQSPRGTPAALQSSISNEWYTPAKYIEAAQAVLGNIDLDPASCEFANRMVKATSIFTKEDDGIGQRWHGRVWMNPPYGRDSGESNQARWSAKLIAEYEAGHILEAIMLVNAVTDRIWFQPLWNYALCFTNHRIEFYNEETVDSDPTHGNVFVYFGPSHETFFNHFQQFGRCVFPTSALISEARHVG